MPPIQMTTTQIEEVIKSCLDKFYERRIATLNKLDPYEVFSRKNPYLYRAIGVNKGDDIIDGILQAYISSSDETIFGSVFIEAVAIIVSGSVRWKTPGVDFVVEDEKIFKVVAMKSGPNIFNSDQKTQQGTLFQNKQTHEEVLQQLKEFNRQYDPILAFGYGHYKTPTRSKKLLNYRILAGQEFWQEMTGESEFYLKLIHLMRDYPQQHALEYKVHLDNTYNRFIRYFTVEFCEEDGSINWDKLVRLNSSSDESFRISPTVKTRAEAKAQKEAKARAEIEAQKASKVRGKGNHSS